MQKTILVSGASMAGLTAAYWLKKYGFRVTVVEKAPALRTGGYAVDLRGPALEVARRMGVLEGVREASTDIHKLLYVDSRHRVLADGVLASGLFSGTGEDRDAEIFRGDLARLLYDAAGEGIEYLWNDSIIAVTMSEASAFVQFKNSAPRHFDIVVGADGLHSRVRSLVFGGEAEFAEHLGYYVAVYAVPNFMKLDTTGYFYGMIGKTAGVYPARDRSSMYAMFYFRAHALQYDRRDTAAQKATVKKQFAGGGWYLDQLLEHIDAADDFYFDSLSLIRMSSWVRERAVLLGDAGYCATPMSGQGTSLAMAGAYVLAGELKAANGDYTRALPAYENELRNFVKANQDTAVSNAKHFIAETKFQIRMGIFMMKLLPWLPGKKRIIRKFREPYLAYTLKEYRK